MNLEAIADEAEAAVFVSHHEDLCGCDGWPQGCKHFPAGTVFSVNAYDVVVAAAPLIEKAVVERILAAAVADHEDDTNPLSAALKARTDRVRQHIAQQIDALATACYDDYIGDASRDAFRQAAALARGEAKP